MENNNPGKNPYNLKDNVNEDGFFMKNEFSSDNNLEKDEINSKLKISNESRTLTNTLKSKGSKKDNTSRDIMKYINKFKQEKKYIRRETDSYGFLINNDATHKKINIDEKTEEGYYNPPKLKIKTDRNIRNIKFDNFIFEGIPFNYKRLFWNILINKDTKQDDLYNRFYKKPRNMFLCCFSSSQNEKQNTITEAPEFLYEEDDESQTEEDYYEKNGIYLEKTNELDTISIDRISSKDLLFTVKQINADIQRTFRNHTLFCESYGYGQAMLFRTLMIFSSKMPTIGYCQGLSCITAILLMYMPEKEALSVLMNFIRVNDIVFLFDSSLSLLTPLLNAQEKIFSMLIPNLYRRLTKNLKNTISKWFLTLFSRFNIEFVLRVWDLMFYYGFPIALLINVVIIEIHGEDILKLRSNEQIMVYISDIDKKTINMDLFKQHMLDYNKKINPYSIKKIIDEEIAKISKYD